MLLFSQQKESKLVTITSISTVDYFPCFLQISLYRLYFFVTKVCSYLFVHLLCIYVCLFANKGKQTAGVWHTGSCSSL